MNAESEMKVQEKQLNVGLVSAKLYYRIDALFKRLNATLEEEGFEPVPKKELFVAAVFQYLSSQASWVEAKEKTRKGLLIEKFLEDIKLLLEGEYDV